MKATLPEVYSEEHSVWHGILNGDIKIDFVNQNALALSTLGSIIGKKALIAYILYRIS